MTTLAVVIPTVPGRERDLDRCLDAYQKHTPQEVDLRLIVEEGHETCGLAWIAGADRAERHGYDYLHLTADDLEPHDGWWWPAKEAADKGAIPAPLVFEPDGSLQSAGIEGFDCYRGPYTDWMEVESTTVPFCSYDQWGRIGMVTLHYCTDLWVSHRARLAGWPTRLRTGMVFTHHNAAAGRGAGMGDQHIRTAHDRAMFERLTA